MNIIAERVTLKSVVNADGQTLFKIEVDPMSEKDLYEQELWEKVEKDIMKDIQRRLQEEPREEVTERDLGRREEAAQRTEDETKQIQGLKVTANRAKAQTKREIANRMTPKGIRFE